jgi:mono/diheme cytochrome c family protein
MQMVHAKNNRRLPPLLSLALLLFLLAGCAIAEDPAVSKFPPTPALDALAESGKQVFVTHCGACHSTSAGTVIVGPSLAGIATHGADRVDGLDARTYVYSSIMQPADYLVDGYEDLMPKDLAKELTGEELDAVVAYLLTLE